MTPEAIRHLAAACPVMDRLIRSTPPCVIRPRRRRSPYEALVRAVVYQQLNGKAAETILNRFIGLFPAATFPAPEQILAVPDEDMRRVGLSRNKAASIRDIAAKTAEGIVPSLRTLRDLEDEQIVERLTVVRGVGRWTVQMFLMSTLARPDVLPVDDYGIRNGYRIAYRKRRLPTPKEMESYGKPWQPHRTTASWYLWRAADMAKLPD